jgi:hypothetical protein
MNRRHRIVRPVRPRHSSSVVAGRFRSQLIRCTRTSVPSLLAVACAGAAHAQGTMDFSGATTLMTTFKTFAMYAGAVICLGGLIFAGIRMMSGRFQFTTPLKGLGVANRDLGTIERLEGSEMTIRVDGKEARSVTVNTEEVRHIDHGYAVTSHSSQGLTAGRVLAHFDTDGPRALINTRLAYVAISRASEDARIYTNDTATLGRRLASDLSKTAAIETLRKGESSAREQVISAFRQHDPQAATTILQRNGKVHEFASADHRLAAVARAYGAASERTVVFAPDTAERRESTALIRDELRQRGVLSGESHTLSILVERPLEEPRVATSYLPGDQIHYKTGSPAEHGIADHSVAQVISVESKTNRLLVRTLDGTEISYNPAVLRVQTDRSRVFREEQREVATGEHIVFTQPDEARHIRRGELGSVCSLDRYVA